MSDIVQWIASNSTPYCDCEQCRRHREAAEEIERLRALVQCCERDHNYDGNCDRHPNGLRGEVERLRAQLPDGMQHCTIQFKQCPKGHGWLTAVNWVQHGCPTCEIERLRAELEQLEFTEHRLTTALGHADADLEEMRQERDEARKAARMVYAALDDPDYVWRDGSLKHRWPWLEDSNTHDE